MEIGFHYIGILFLTFLGFAVGIILSLIAPEEMKDGKKYFRMFRAFIFALIVFFLCEFFGFGIIVTILVSLFLLLILISIKNEKLNYFLYASLGIVMAIVYNVQNQLILQSSLIFLFGIPCGSLFKMERKFILQDYIKIISFFLIYVLIGLIGIIFV